ncbi:retrovirus-related pol polyprotein from transposon TNT 1-94 [Tanacetum coccineum]
MTKDHPLQTLLANPSPTNPTRKSNLKLIHVSVYFDAFLTSVEPKNFKEVMLESSWIDAIANLDSSAMSPTRIYDHNGRQDGFLKWRAQEDLTVLNPEDLFDQDNPSHVYKLKKALYGLKQAPRAWYDMLSRKACEKHLHVVKLIFGYLKGTIHLVLWYLKDTGISLTAYSDSNHAGCQDTRRSTSGSAQFLGDKLVSWSSKKQKSTAISNYGFQFNKIPLYCDNKSAIALCCNNVQHSRAKHIDVRYHFIKEQVENGIVELYFVRTEYQLADIFTKPLPRERFEFLIEKLDLSKTTKLSVVIYLATDEEIVTFHQRNLGTEGDITNLVHCMWLLIKLHQPRRTFDCIINKCLSGKITGLDKIRLSRAQILWGMYYNKNVNFVELLWEDFVFQIDNKDHKKQEKIDTLSMSVSKKKAPAKAERSKGIELLSDAALLEEAQLKRAIKKSRRETNIHQAGGSSEGTDLESEVPDEPKGKSIDTSEGTGLKPGVPDVSKADSSKSEYESWGDSDDDNDDDDHKEMDARQRTR